MSSQFYDDELRDAILKVRDLLSAENLPEGFVADPKNYISHFGALYVQYVQVFRQLEDIHDQTLQPQKRRDIFKLLEAVIGRVLELNKVLVGVNNAEHPCLSDILVDLKLLPATLELPVPRYMVSSRTKSINERNMIIKSLIREYDLPMPPPLEQDPVALRSGTSAMTQEQAILLIQTAERGRQGRQRAMFMKVIRAQEDAERKILEGGDMDVDPDDAATKIQRTFRGFASRNLVDKMREEENVFLGMAPRVVPDPSKTPKFTEEQVRNQRKILQKQFEQDLQESMVPLKKQMIDIDGQKFKDEWHDAVLEHILQKKVATGKLDKIPTAEEGGSLKYVEDQEPKPPGEGEEEEDPKGKKGKDKGKKGKDDKKGKKKGKGDEEEEEKDTVIEPSKFAGEMVVAAQRIIDVWENGVIPSSILASAQAAQRPGSSASVSGGKGAAVAPPPTAVLPENASAAARVNQGPLAVSHMQLTKSRHNPLVPANTYMVDGESTEKPNLELLREELRMSVEEELRKEVDAKLRLELENMEGGDAGKGKGKKGKSKKGKKGKKGKGKKGKKDATEGEDPNIQFARLVSLGVIQESPAASMNDFVGDFNPLTSLYESQNVMVDPSFADVRHASILYGVLSLGVSESTHKTIPHTRGILLYGPQGSGKTLLSKAICAATGALWINLSPSNLEGKVEGKEVGKLLSRVFRVAKLHGPTVIYIDDADQVFAGVKKGKKTSGSGIGGKMTKDLQAKVKELVPGDRVLIVANSRSPGSIDTKTLLSCVDHVVYCPRPDYGTRVKLWEHFVVNRQHGPRFADVQYQNLAHLTDGYTAGSICNIVEEVVTERRVKKLDAKPLTPEEFLTPLAKRDPVWMDVYEEMKSLNDALSEPYCRKKPPKPKSDEDDDGKDKKGKKGGKKKK
nr:dynein regulatory complex protein 11 [Andalucia godoyi]|eukprot:ANDGO_00210.mRNA.1 Protein SAV